MFSLEWLTHVKSLVHGCMLHTRHFNHIQDYGPGIIIKSFLQTQSGTRWEIEFDGGEFWEEMRGEALKNVDHPGRISFIRDELVLLKVAPVAGGAAAEAGKKKRKKSAPE